MAFREGRQEDQEYNGPCIGEAHGLTYVVTSMRTVIQNSKTFLYFAGCDLWVRNQDQALDFEKTVAAIHFIKIGLQSEDIQVVMSLDDAGHDFWLGTDELG